jgi:riboflavin kinase/FMN adenylyltransferase
MRIIYQSEKDIFPPCVATVGFFDGLHVGHRFLIEELKAIATSQNKKSVVVTFSDHPRKVLHSDFQPQLITTLSEKLFQLETTGIDTCIVLDFTIEMAKLSAYEFLKTILFEQFNVQTLLVGHDHRFGHNRTDGINEYQQYGNQLGLEVIEAKYYSTETDHHISSSTIRSALKNGNIELANRLLTYEYSFMGKVINGFKVGHKIGFPTANIEPEDTEKLIPAIGVYAVRVRWNSRYYKGMMNIGNRPTMDNGENISIEVHIIDFDTNIYNETVEIDFIRKIRDEKKFNSVEELVEQLHKDKQSVLDLH